MEAFHPSPYRLLALGLHGILRYSLSMPLKRKEPCDMNEIAFDIVRSCTSENLSPVERQKNPAAVALDRLDGLSVGESPRGALVARKRTEMTR